MIMEDNLQFIKLIMGQNYSLKDGEIIEKGKKLPSGTHIHITCDC